MGEREEVRERGIGFIAEMRRAVRNGTKTQTRRVIKLVGDDDAMIFLNHGSGWWPYRSDDGESELKTVIRHGKTYLDEIPYRSPYEVGDRLWVKETWRIHAWNEDEGTIRVQYRDDGALSDWIRISDEERFQRYWVQSMDDAVKAGLTRDSGGLYHWNDGKSPCRWRSSRFMPKALARTWLEVTAVRAQQLQEISIDDIYAEGCPPMSSDEDASELYEWFSDLWDSLNAKRGYGWEVNPGVWAYTFKEVKR